MKLILLPEKPGPHSGYGIAIKNDLIRLSHKKEDLIVYYSKFFDHKPNEKIIFKSKKITINRLFNVLARRPTHEISRKQLLDHINFKLPYTDIFCGEVIFYKAIRQLIPEKKIMVRFHNCYSLLRLRKNYFNIPIDFRFKYNIEAFSKLEEQIFQDDKAIPIFITKNEYSFFKLIYPKKEAKLWEIELNNIEIDINEGTSFKDVSLKLIWFGSVSTHKRSGLLYFIKNIFPKIKYHFPNVELHLYGNGTKKYNSINKSIVGHGFYQGGDLPAKGIYINPDIIGGGVKLKLHKIIKYNMPFITTPYGIEGNVIPEGYPVIISDIENWADDLKSKLT